MVSFKDTKQEGEFYQDYGRFVHYHTPSQLIRYYSNFFLYDEVPDLATFKADEKLQSDFHEARGQHHLLFIFPDNVELPHDLMLYAESASYKLEKMELYRTDNLTLKKRSGDVKVVSENDEIFADFLKVCRAGELEYGEEFADLKEEMHTRDLEDDSIIQLVAYHEDQPVGKLEAIINESIIELDDFYVLEGFRGLGIGSALQQQVLTFGKSLLLIADGNDTPREMYERQGYRKISERYELLKVKSSSD
ncbi:GNAT family N-acetyltransferase [Macrococcus carouselicus]|uniref:GNAT family N-acetyltransferase n=1 Tax=Macrococcus carouselicus TaxID=69969 RepID=A0A9Q8CLZ7_9STAP|nr:GNAT family N-acetyltransferase [Macrococcus carouselicus]TDM02306.1 GNAT family N-acetyltransferase [Macrococcus carouselicus]